jgi:hypothetical protein
MLMSAYVLMPMCLLVTVQWVLGSAAVTCPPKCQDLPGEASPKGSWLCVIAIIGASQVMAVEVRSYPPKMLVQGWGGGRRVLSDPYGPDRTHSRTAVWELGGVCVLWSHLWTAPSS